MEKINGKHYPLWSQFVERKDEWIGGKLVNEDMGLVAETTITDIELVPNGEESAFFRICGKDFNYGFDVHYGGVSGERAVPKGTIVLWSSHVGAGFIYHKETDEANPKHEEIS
jgi:hypothetical protein